MSTYSPSGGWKSSMAGEFVGPVAEYGNKVGLS